jgi:glycine/D-amino acid oxidase-like deaminating enzyme
MKADFIIVGQGLAGSVLAWSLIQKQLRVIVVDDHHRGSSSQVAAGVVNPISGKRMLKSWNVDRCLPAAVSVYRSMEAILQRSLYHEMPVLRWFDSRQERDLWQHRRVQTEYQPYFGAELEAEPTISNAYGGCNIRQSGFLNTRELLAGIKAFLQHHDSYIETAVDYEQIRLPPGEVVWQDMSAKRLIFCEGHRMLNNPWFSGLPLQPAQGEILTLKVTPPLPRHIINRGKWLLPLEPDKIKVGATFQWQPIDGKPTEQGKQELLAASERLWHGSRANQLVDHECGVRPGTRDKKPFIGMHPRYPQLGVFNGFGAKGSLWIPYYAEQFAAFLSGSAALPEETDIRRFAGYEA